MKIKSLKRLKCISSRLAALALFCFIASAPVQIYGFDNDAACVKPSNLLLPEGAKVSERIFGLNGLSNIGRVSPEIYRGAQPLKEGYAVLKKLGIKTVVNLRSTHSEKKEVEAAGMKSIEVPMSMLKDVDVKVINNIIDIMADPDNQPVYVHCKLGQDRTGIVIAAYRMKIEGWPLKDAEAEMQAFGFNDMWSDFKKFIRDYAKSLGK